MSRIAERPTRRYRAQFSMSKQTWNTYMEAANLAAELGMVIDYRADFERWFLKLLDTVIKELQEKKAAAPIATEAASE